MILWRISTFPDLSGRGGLLASGRWHHIGRPVVYLSETPAAAMLEVLVHLEVDPQDVPENLRLMRVQVPDDVKVRCVSELPEHWEDDLQKTRDAGSAWLASSDGLLLSVPSAIMPRTRNFLFNPLHPDAVRATLAVETLRFDRRLLRRER